MSAAVVTLIAVDGVDAAAVSGDWPALRRALVHPGAVSSDHVASSWLPRLHRWVDLPPSELAFDGRPSPVLVDSFAIGLLCLESSVQLLIRVVVAGAHADFVQAQRLLFDPKVSVTAGGRSLLAAASEAAVPTTASLSSAWRHQILFAEGGSDVTGSGMPGAEPTLSPGLVALLFKDLGVRHRPEHVDISVPRDMNSPDGVLVAVWATNTLCYGYDRYDDADNQYLGSRRVLDVVVANTQVLAARQQCRRLRDEALRSVERDDQGEHGSVAERRRVVGRRLHEVRELLRSTGSFAAIHVHGLAVPGGRPVESYHRALVDQSGLRADVEMTRTIVQDLVGIIETEHLVHSLDEGGEHALALQRLLSTSAAIRTIGVIVGAIAGVLAVAALFTAAAAIPGEQETTIFGSVARAAGFVAVTVVAAVLMGWASATLFHARSRPRVRVLTVGGAAASAVTAVVFTIRLLAGDGDGTVAMVAVTAASALVALLLAYAIDPDD